MAALHLDSCDAGASSVIRSRRRPFSSAAPFPGFESLAVGKAFLPASPVREMNDQGGLDLSCDRLSSHLGGFSRSVVPEFAPSVVAHDPVIEPVVRDDVNGASSHFASPATRQHANREALQSNMLQMILIPGHSFTDGR